MMSLSTRESSSGGKSSDEDFLDLFGSDSEEEPADETNEAVENILSKNLDLSQQTNWDRLPAELRVMIFCMDIDNYSSLSSLSRMHYHLLNDYWHKQIRIHLTEFPELALNESYHHYYTRMVQEIIGKLPAPGASILDGTEGYEKSRILSVAIKFGFEELVAKTIKQFPCTPLTEKELEERKNKQLPIEPLTETDCKFLFRQIGKKHGKGKIAIVRMLLELIAKFSDEVRYKLIAEGCLSFIADGNTSFAELKRGYICEGEAFSLLWNALPTNLREKLAHGEPVDPEEEVAPSLINRRMLRLVEFGSALTDIQCILETYPAEKREEYVVDTIFFACFFGPFSHIELLTTIAHSMSSLLKTLPDDRKHAVSINAFKAAIVFCTQQPLTIDIFATMPKLPSGFMQYLESLPKDDESQVIGLILDEMNDSDDDSCEDQPERIQKLLAKALFCVAYSCSLVQLGEQLLLLECLSESDRSKVISRCVAYSIVSGLEIEKITLLLSKTKSTKALGTLLIHAVDGIIKNPNTIKQIIDISKKINTLEDTLQYLLFYYQNEYQVTLANAKNLINQFPADLCQKVLRRIITAMLINEVSNPTIKNFLQTYNGEKHLDQVLSDMFIVMADRKEDEKAKFLLQCLPRDSNFKAPIVYLDRMIQLNRNADEIMKAFALYFDRQPEATAIYNMGVYDAQQKTNVLAFFAKHHVILCDPMHTALTLAMNIQPYFEKIWGALNPVQKVSLLSTNLVELSYELAGLIRSHSPEKLAADIKTLQYLYKSLPIKSRRETLLNAVKRAVEEKKSLQFNYMVVELTLKRYIVTLANILYRFLENTWQLDKIKILLSDIQKDHIKHVILYALHLAILHQKNQMIIALLNLPVSLGCIEKKTLDEMVEFLRGEKSHLKNVDKEYLAAVISPQVPVKRQSLAPNLQAAPQHIGFYKSTPDIHIQCTKMLASFSAACAKYRLDCLTRNTHDKLAELIIHLIDSVKNDATEFKLHVTKMLLKTLHLYFNKRNSEKFISYIDDAIKEHSQLLPDVNVIDISDEFIKITLKAFNSLTMFEDVKAKATSLLREFRASYRQQSVSL